MPVLRLVRQRADEIGGIGHAVPLHAALDLVGMGEQDFLDVGLFRLNRVVVGEKPEAHHARKDKHEEKGADAEGKKT